MSGALPEGLFAHLLCKTQLLAVLLGVLEADEVRE